MNRIHTLVMLGLILASGSARAAIVAGDKIAIDVMNASQSTTTYAFAGIFAPTNATWNINNGNALFTNLANTAGSTVTGVTFDSVPKTIGSSGGVWSNWGSVVVAGETNSVTQDYIFDGNSNKTDTNYNGTGTAFDAGSRFGGLDVTLHYNIAVHINRIQSNGALDGASVTIGAATINLPSSGANAANLTAWNDGGFTPGLSSAVFLNVAPTSGGFINLFYNRAGANPLIFTGIEIQAIAIPAPAALPAGLGLMALTLARRRTRR
ncbi:MAG: hypothetical protein GC162_15865 [Planctomycetes bacterium]|nr:hypothetical protein [Planctomycetota bacterium]